MTSGWRAPTRQRASPDRSRDCKVNTEEVPRPETFGPPHLVDVLTCSCVTHLCVSCPSAQLRSVQEEMDSLEEEKESELEEAQGELRMAQEEVLMLQQAAEEAAGERENDIASLQEELCRLRAELQRLHATVQEYELEITTLRAEISMKSCNGDTPSPGRTHTHTHTLKTSQRPLEDFVSGHMSEPCDQRQKTN